MKCWINVSHWSEQQELLMESSLIILLKHFYKLNEGKISCILSLSTNEPKFLSPLIISIIWKLAKSECKYSSKILSFLDLKSFDKFVPDFCSQTDAVHHPQAVASLFRTWRCRYKRKLNFLLDFNILVF